MVVTGIQAKLTNRLDDEIQEMENVVEEA